MTEDHEEIQNCDDILNVTAVDISHKLDDDAPDIADGQSTSPLLDYGYDQKSSTTFPMPTEAHNTALTSENSTDSTYHRQPQSNNQNVPEVSAHISLHKSSPEVSDTTEHHSLSNLKPHSDLTHNSHINPPSANVPSVKTSAKTSSTQMSSRNEPLSSHSTNTNHKHARHMNELTMDNSQHKKFQNDQFINRNSVATETHREYDYKMSPPQEESWVKQLFVARDKSIAQAEGGQRRQQNEEQFDNKHFTSNAAKFTTMVEEPSPGGTGETKPSNQERPKAGLY